MTRFLFAILFIGLAGFVFCQFTQPVLNDIGSLRAEKARLETGLENAKEVRAELTKLLDVYNSFSPAELDRLNKFLPDRLDPVRLVIDVNAIAERSGMQIKGIQLSALEEGNQPLGGAVKPAQNQTGEQTAGAVSAAADKATLGFAVTGPYSNFKSFVSDLAKSLRLADVKTLSLAPHKEKDGLYDYNIEVQTYWLK